jgi:hypothetical protein
MARARKLNGTFPPEADGWRRLAVVEDGGVDWHIFFRDGDPAWHQWKVAAKGKALRKANFWFSFLKAKPGSHANHELLREHHPKVFDVLEEVRAQVTGADDLL